MADAIHGNTELGVTKDELIIAAVQKELQFKAKLAPTVFDASIFAEPGNDVISFPKLTSFSVTNRVEGVAGDATTISSSLDSMLLDQNAYIAYIVDKKTRIQNKINVEVALAARAASAHGRYVDERIIATAEAAAGLSVLAGSPAAVTKSNILDMLEFIEANDGDMDQAVLVVSVSQKKAMLQIDDFSRADAFGQPTTFTGQIGQLYGVPVMVHNGLQTDQILCYDRDGLALGMQSAPDMSEENANSYGAGAMRVAMDQIFGTKALQLGEKGLGATESPLIAKLID